MSERRGPKEATGAKRGRGRPRGGGKPSGRRVPPPDSEVWPEQYRGKNFKSIYAALFMGKCQMCAYSCPLPRSRQLRDRFHGEARLLHCTNHPSCPGQLREVLPIETCRNFKMKFWQTPAPKRKGEPASPVFDGSDPTVRRIPLGHGLFAVVDAEDYEWLSKYKWHAQRRGRKVYAISVKKGKVVYMHRMIMRPCQGYVVDHLDGNGLNNRRCNLRVCTRQENAVNMGPRGGASEFVGVHRHKDKWEAQIVWRGKKHHVGVFADEVEAAKARDRKAYELHGEFAYLNFPEDFAGR